MIHPSSASVLILLLAATACSTPPVAAPPADWLASAGFSDGAITLLAYGEAVDVGEAPSPLTEAQAVTLALRHSPVLQAELAQLAAAAAESAQTRRWPNPLLSIALRFPEAGGAAQWDLGVSAALGALLNRGGRMDLADARLRAATAAALEVAFEEAARAREAFADIMLHDATAPIRAQQVRLAEAALQRTRARAAIGEAGADELRAVEVSASRAASVAERAHAHAREARLRLAALLGTPSGTAVWALSATPSTIDAFTEEDWMSAALSQQARVQRARALADAAAAEAGISGSPFRNGLEAGISAERDGAWNAGPAAIFPLPLFDDGSAERTAAEARALAAAHELVGAQRDAIARTRAAWFERQVATQANARMQSQVLPALHATLERVRAAAEIGELSVAAVLDAEDAFLAAQAESLLAVHAVRLAHARLVLAAGGNPRSDTLAQR